jgi:hypothetical protein
VVVADSSEAGAEAEGSSMEEAVVAEVARAVAGAVVVVAATAGKVRRAHQEMPRNKTKRPNPYESGGIELARNNSAFGASYHEQAAKLGGRIAMSKIWKYQMKGIL